VVIIAVVMFFAAMGTASFWILRWIGKPVAETLPVGPEIYKAFVYPDLVLSALLIVGTCLLFILFSIGYLWKKNTIFRNNSGTRNNSVPVPELLLTNKLV